MTLPQLILAQLQDPFRIVLIVALVFTMLRTQSQTGTWLPLAAGVVFVAGIIPSTFGSTLPEPFWLQFGTGLVANGIILAVVLGLYALYQRISQR
ncbi:hypothetical protein Q9295_11735 [Xinfangfangia sp. CPCC 101601]|uniref:Uncharacterized protein n=1 Tax=Pseudogemmobacter lacusdianii TaxID=3069608 RepID=A0ABU0W1V1_9RHOB|nr:hypothetical protein [Xinfangfangia sp. CPCC 101601]MDQ2067050.1 hypothetical protein [Xinfangfangia sp. CPCC 101601]